MKHLFSTCACLLASSLAADAPEPTQPQTQAKPIPVTQGCNLETFKSDGVTWGFYGELLYLQPNGSNLTYGVEANGLDQAIAVPAISPNWTVLEIDPDYHLGFEVGASSTLNAANLEIGLSWERLHAHDTKSFTAPAAAGFMVGPPSDIGPNSASYKIATGRATFNFDEANVSFGRELCFFNNFHTKFYGGAGFARIKQSILSTYSNLGGTPSRSIESNSTFTGAGPQIGLDYRYRICKGFFFTGNSVLSLFMGQLKNGTTYKSFSPTLATLGIAQPNTQRTTVPNRSQLVPGLEQKIGFSYIATWSRVRALFEIGYQCQIYLNAVQTTDMTAPQVEPSLLPSAVPDAGVFAVGFERTLDNFILTGLYASVGIDF